MYNIPEFPVEGNIFIGDPLNYVNSGKLGFSGSKLALVFGLAVLLAAALIPRLVKPDQYVATDEVPWLVRSGNFYYALAQKQFEETSYGH